MLSDPSMVVAVPDAARLRIIGRGRPCTSGLDHGGADGSVTVALKQSRRVELPRIRLSETGVIGLTPLKAEPEGPAEGDTYYDASRHKLRTFDGRVWLDLW